MVVIELDNVSYSYSKNAPALKNISLKIKEGERVVILGPNGCGKSTLLKIMDNLLIPQKGRVMAFGKVLDNKNPSLEYEFRRKVGFVFQDPDVQLFNTNVFDEVAFAPLELGMKKHDVVKLVEDTLKSFNIYHLKDRPPYRLSEGEKKKVALASVMVINPIVLLLDEPTNGLDPRSKRYLIRKLLELNEKGTTIVIATHNLEVAKTIASKVVIMNEEHRIETIGAPDEVLNDKPLLLKVNLV